MKKVSFLFTSLLIALTCYQANAQSWTVTEINLGTVSVLGEMQDSRIGVNQLNPQLSVSLHTRGARSRRVSYGGSINTYLLNMAYADGDKNWLEGHYTTGRGINALASIRLLLTGRDDMRFMKGAFITYIEAGAGAHYFEVQSTYPPDLALDKTSPTADRPVQKEFAPAAGVAIGFQYFISQNWGVNLRLNGQYIASDIVDGVEGTTGIDDMMLSSSVGMIYAF